MKNEGFREALLEEYASHAPLNCFHVTGAATAMYVATGRLKRKSSMASWNARGDSWDANGDSWDAKGDSWDGA